MMIGLAGEGSKRMPFAFYLLRFFFLREEKEKKYP